MTPLKLVISGPVGAGKTTFVRTLSQTPVVDTDVEASEDIGKRHTTVAFDYGSLQLGDQLLHLYGTPGQDRFEFMWEVLCEGALGLIMLVAGDQPREFVQARRILEFITTRTPLPFVVGVTRSDCPPIWSPGDVAAYFGLPAGQVMALNATDADDARLLLIRLLEHALFLSSSETLPPESLFPEASLPDLVAAR